MFYTSHRQRISNSQITQRVQNTFKNNRKMAVCAQYRGHIGVGNQLKCAPQAVTLQQAPSPCLHWHVRGRIARKPDWFFQCWMFFDPDFPLCGIFAKMLICLYEYTLRNLFSNFSVSIYIFPVCPIIIFSKVLVWQHFNWLLNYHTFTN